MKLDSTTACSGNGWTILATLVGFAVIVLVYSYRYTPPPPKPIDASETEFSAARAEKILHALVGDNIPHPAGSAQNKVVSQRIIKQLKEYGYQVEIQEGVRHSYVTHGPVPVKNVMAKLKGTGGGRAVMLAAHFDSVPDGPGAADDGVGVAVVLEIARMLKAQNPPKNDVIFLLTDGEEAGLIGSDLFAYHHPLESEVGIVINLEARGTSGPSFMFETSEHNRTLIDIFAQNIEKPFTSSLAVEVYKRLPHDTDFTHFKRSLMAGYNFAFVGDGQNYHTPNDRFDVVDRGSLQHHGENMYSLVQALKMMDIALPLHGKAVYFDVFGWKVIWWPADWSAFLSAGSIALLLVGFYLALSGFQRGKKAIWKPILAIPIVVASIAFSCGLLWLLDYGLTMLGLFGQPWIDHPVLCALAFWLTGIGATGFISSQLARFLDDYSIWFGVWLIWSVSAIVLSYHFVAASYLFIAPAIVASLAGLCIVFLYGRHAERNVKWLVATTAVVAAVIWLPLEQVFYDVIGFSMNLVLIGRIGIVSSVLIPVFVSSGTTASLATSKLCCGAFVACTAWLLFS